MGAASCAAVLLLVLCHDDVFAAGGSMQAESERAQRRVKFDFEITFQNGGGLQGQDFRLDLPGEEISDAALADYIVADLRLLMVRDVKILRKQIITEPHKRPARASSAADASRWVDLSHVVEDGMVTYPGLPPPAITQFLTREASRQRYAPGTEFSIGRIEMVANTGTYLDAPFHRYAGATDLAELPLARVADLEGVVVRASSIRAITPEHFSGVDVRNKAVLIHTGRDRHWRTEAYSVDTPYLTAAAARWLIEHGAVVVGIDALNIDDTRDSSRPVHSALLAADILIIEHLRNLQALPDRGFKFFAVPVKVRGMGTFPVRAFALLDAEPRG